MRVLFHHREEVVAVQEDALGPVPSHHMELLDHIRLEVESLVVLEAVSLVLLDGLILHAEHRPNQEVLLRRLLYVVVRVRLLVGIEYDLADELVVLVDHELLLLVGEHLVTDGGALQEPWSKEHGKLLVGEHHVHVPQVPSGQGVGVNQGLLLEPQVDLVPSPEELDGRDRRVVAHLLSEDGAVVNEALIRLAQHRVEGLLDREEV